MVSLPSGPVTSITHGPLAATVTGQRLAADVSPAFMFCLEDDGLDVRPLFWGPAGLVDVPVGKSVRYIWKSGAFEKTVSGKPE